MILHQRWFRNENLRGQEFEVSYFHYAQNIKKNIHMIIRNITGNQNKMKQINSKIENF